MSRLNDLLRQLESKDPSLAKELRTEYDALADRRAFGLNFERHTPESVELPGRRIRKGDKVHVLPERGMNPTKENSRLWRVTALDRDAETATIEDASIDPVETEVRPLTELVVVAEFRDPIYPGLVSTRRIERGGDKPFHTIINAENYHALQTLLFTHRGKVDCIYIDPPYNTGNDGWIYNDRYVAGDDHYKHSKWLAFIERRLLIARELLKPTGVIVVAVGDDEHHRLRMLMDQVFNADNFIANLVWQGGASALSKYTAGGLDYMLVYARDEDALAASGVRWRERKPGIELAEAAARVAWDQSGGDAQEATRLYRASLRNLKDKIGAGVFRYDQIDSEGRVFRPNNLSNSQYRPNLQYDVVHPVTGKVVRMNRNGWAHSRERMELNLAEGRVYFGPDETTIPQLKRFLREDNTQVPYPSFNQSRMPGSRRLEATLGDKRFPFPKDHEVLMRWMKIVAPTDAVIVDFFGGSASTVEAVARLNQDDGGTRRCVLVTNNEVAAADAKSLREGGLRPGDAEWEAKGVFEYVAKPRITTIVTGFRPDGSAFSDGLEQNLEFMELTYESPLRISSSREFERVAPMLWMKAGSTGRIIGCVQSGWDIADTYGVLADLDQSDVFVNALLQREIEGNPVEMAFIVTDEDRLFASICRELPVTTEPVRLYEAYLRNFEIEAGRSAR